MRIMNRRPTHPGEILLHHYLSERGIGIGEFAGTIGMHRASVSAIIHGRGRVTAETAVRFAVALDTSREIWLNLQAAVDIHEARRKPRRETRAA